MSYMTAAGQPIDTLHTPRRSGRAIPTGGAPASCADVFGVAPAVLPAVVLVRDDLAVGIGGRAHFADVCRTDSCPNRARPSA